MNTIVRILVEHAACYSVMLGFSVFAGLALWDLLAARRSRDFLRQRYTAVLFELLDEQSRNRELRAQLAAADTTPARAAGEGE